ncbi:Golgi integral membrane protein 4 isoform X2 [Rhinatrema bivittatum]|uniref:Golgi integral membrane protein 4 isoform X2 n=1 Tax=Rhinatrema bivittatum TaxID=194408 RepID=UPI00112CE116|nr:Golgi integral membrane protein 4 isoform X2 [Rhinatrema bivittatum]
MRGTMGQGMCSRRQRRALQTLALLAVLLGFLYGAMVSYDLQAQLKKAEAVALKYQQHQESLSAQLQDFLVYKLEAQETLNKGRQDSNNRYSALNVQHQMLKNQHDDLKKQYSDLQLDHQKLGEDLTRTFSDHKQKYVHLQQEKEQEMSKMKENVYNLREENRQLRKAHQDIHVQLQDVKQQHKGLRSQHDQVLLTLEDHKSALAAAQSQVEEYKQLKDTLKKMPSLRETEKQQPLPTTPSVPSDSAARQRNAAIAEPLENERKPQKQEVKAEPGNIHFHNAPEEAELPPQPKREAEVESPTETDVQHRAEEAEEHKRELEEEEMEQVGRPERLVDEQDQVQEEEQQAQAEENPKAGDHGQEQEEANLLEEQVRSQRFPTIKPVMKNKSAYEEQLEQQQLAAQRAEEARQLKERQEALQERILRQQRVREQELVAQRQREYQEKPLHRNQLRQQAPYDTLDHDIVQGEEEQAGQDGGAYEREDHQHLENVDEIVKVYEEQDPEAEKQQGEAAAEEVNPADDPNNQGEDEFEEAEQEREENLPDENEQKKPSSQERRNPGMEEHLVMAGNPDQQEDNVDEQYQEEGEEVQEDLGDGKKREVEHNGEGPYGENGDQADEKNSELAERELGAQEKNNPKEGHEENYEEEEEDEGEAVDRNNQRAEM